MPSFATRDAQSTGVPHTVPSHPQLPPQNPRVVLLRPSGPVQANADKSRCLNGGLCLAGQLRVLPRWPTASALIEGVSQYRQLLIYSLIVACLVRLPGHNAPFLWSAGRPF